MADLVDYVIFQGARETVRRLDSLKMARNHLEILQKIDLSKSPAVDSRALRGLATAKEAESLKVALEAPGTDSTQFPALSVFETTGLLEDAKQFIEEWHRFLISVLTGLGKSARLLNRMYEKFARTQSGSDDVGNSQTQSQPQRPAQQPQRQPSQAQIQASRSSSAAPARRRRPKVS